MTTGQFKVGAQSGRRADAAEQSDTPEIEEASQRVGPFVEIPSLLRDLGVDPPKSWPAPALTQRPSTLWRTGSHTLRRAD